MSECVLVSKRPGGDVRAVLEELAGSVARDIAALPDRAKERIHDIRVDMKKFRHTVRLTSAVLPSRDRAKLDDLACEIKDAFGAARDREVQTDLLRTLLGDPEAAAAAAALPADDDETDSPAGDGAGNACKKLSVLVAKLDLRKLTRGQVITAWGASYRDARRMMAACREDVEDDLLFHEWRKRVKQVLYQSAVLGPPADNLVSGAQELSSALGSQHDLALLCENISLCGPDAERLAFDKKRMTARLALDLGRRIFRKKTSALLKRLSGSPDRESP
ncbi:MAG: CHAD domain-containing protein [Verrucomicrobiae bacterium]